MKKDVALAILAREYFPYKERFTEENNFLGITCRFSFTVTRKYNVITLWGIDYKNFFQQLLKSLRLKNSKKISHKIIKKISHHILEKTKEFVSSNPTVIIAHSRGASVSHELLEKTNIINKLNVTDLITISHPGISFELSEPRKYNWVDLSPSNHLHDYFIDFSNLAGMDEIKFNPNQKYNVDIIKHGPIRNLDKYADKKYDKKINEHFRSSKNI